jgi:hypothetical protein
MHAARGLGEGGRGRGRRRRKRKRKSWARQNKGHNRRKYKYMDPKFSSTYGSRHKESGVEQGLCELKGRGRNAPEREGIPSISRTNPEDIGAS